MVDTTNPLLEPSSLPFSLPPYGRIRPEHYAEAFDAGMREQRAEVERIVTTALESLTLGLIPPTVPPSISPCGVRLT